MSSTSGSAEHRAWLAARSRKGSGADAAVPTVTEATPGVTAVPSGDELVIDLPEGQKVILGRLPPGTVVEIASWRGTGPPDSRTSRLLLGTTEGTASHDPTSRTVTRASTPRGHVSKGRGSLAARLSVIAIFLVAVAALGLVVYTGLIG